MLLPVRTIPYAEELNDNVAKLLVDSVLPKPRKSNILSVEAILATP